MNRRLAFAALAALAVGLGVVPLLVAGCGSSSSESAAMHAMPDGAGAPSQTASMICSEEIRSAVRRSLDLPSTPVGLPAWHHRLYSCTYRVADGDLRLSVKDLDQVTPGRAYYDRLRHRLAPATDIRGLANFGSPAFETPHGDVVFIKDHKTLWVDATRLRTTGLPPQATRQDVAYGVAAAVIGCWTE